MEVMLELDDRPDSVTIIQCFWNKSDRLIPGPELEVTGLYITFKELWPAAAEMIPRQS